MVSMLRRSTPPAIRAPRLLGEGGAQRVRLRVAHGLDHLAARARCPRPPSGRGTRGRGRPTARRAPASLSSTARADSPCASRRMRRPAEGVGVHDVRAGGVEAAVDVLHLGRVRDVPLLRALAGGEPALHERAAQPAVQQQRACGDEGEEVHGPSLPDEARQPPRAATSRASRSASRRGHAQAHVERRGRVAPREAAREQRRGGRLRAGPPGGPFVDGPPEVDHQGDLPAHGGRRDRRRVPARDSAR